MSLPDVVSRDEWLGARRELLAAEKAFTKERDALNTRRRELPMVLVEKGYAFNGVDGPVGLIELFEGRDQLVVYHFMFQPEWDAGCPNCTGFVDDIGSTRLLNEANTTFALVSRAPYEKLAAYRETRGWEYPWFSSYGSDFNYDYHVTLDESVVPFEYNYRTKAEWDVLLNNEHTQTQQPFDLHGLSCFLRVDENVYHTYSTYGRGPDAMTFTATALDLTALGRQEPWEKPEGRSLESPDDHCH
ncbi:putative dithiol-disulfide oxidoreductase (DUF899 family) [Kribbella sp. VKM Ac-2569]|uniref:DUF899 domain-containing protein n=1 Tax=Kribbella sp. VKM Ac-2569 TaxID=2512220 RepID=UPI00102C2D4D|nr:DUF899 domain-containing protein [Kribbella sp. VKM Ac-2569]RZT26997.1 putative dithiol-disulfide oxidoreductase (DUF899 family) [Kribbella sp. VKM Ac-2569]